MQTDKLQHTIEMVTHFAYLQPVPDVHFISSHSHPLAFTSVFD